MTRRLVGCMLLVAVFFSALPWELSASEPVNEQALSAVDAARTAPCPERPPTPPPGNDGCLCFCCPVHALAPSSSGLVLKAPLPDVQRSILGYAAEPHSREVVERIFRPPRLG